jgi:hypothetical protein
VLAGGKLYYILVLAMGILHYLLVLAGGKLYYILVLAMGILYYLLVLAGGKLYYILVLAMGILYYLLVLAGGKLYYILVLARGILYYFLALTRHNISFSCTCKGAQYINSLCLQECIILFPCNILNSIIKIILLNISCSLNQPTTLHFK